MTVREPDNGGRLLSGRSLKRSLTRHSVVLTYELGRTGSPNPCRNATRSLWGNRPAKHRLPAAARHRWGQPVRPHFLRTNRRIECQHGLIIGARSPPPQMSGCTPRTNVFFTMAELLAFRRRRCLPANRCHGWELARSQRRRPTSVRHPNFNKTFALAFVLSCKAREETNAQRRGNRVSPAQPLQSLRSEVRLGQSAGIRRPVRKQRARI